MKIRASIAIFFTVVPVVLWAQNVNGQQPAAPSQAPAARPASVANSGFPARVDTQAAWEAKQPSQGASPTAQGPATTPYGNQPGQQFGPATGQSSGAGAAAPGAIKVKPLPSPKIDYVDEAIQRVSPMGPKDIRRFNDEMYDRMVEGSRVPGGEYNLRGSRMVKVNLAPGAKPEEVDIALGMGAMISFVDRTGARLIVDAAEGFSDAFAVRVMKTELAETEGAHTFSIDAKRPTGLGSVSVQLLGVISPYVFKVRVGKNKDVDSHVQFVLPIVSNKRQVLPGDRMTSDATFMIPEMQGFLAGIPPEGAVEVKVNKVGETAAWMWNNKLYLRTPHTVISGWFKRQASADGMAIYELPLTPMVSMAAEGREVRAVLDFPYIPPITKTRN